MKTVWKRIISLKQFSFASAKNRRIDPEHGATEVASDHTEEDSGQTDIQARFAIQIAKRIFEFMNAHEFQAAEALCTENCECIISETDIRFTMREHIEEDYNLAASFPDLAFTNLQYQYNPDTCKVHVTFDVSGTHTGKPYGFGPYPEIETSGIKCLNPNESAILEINEEGLVQKFVVTTPSELSGPAGFYSQIGGFPGI